MTKASYFFNLGLSPHENEGIFNRETLRAKKRLPLRRKRRYALLLENLSLLFEYRRQIENLPKYANTPIEFLSLGFAYRQLDLRHLFLLWDNPSFQTLCDCGNTAVVTSFGGSPFSGLFSATAICPHCQKTFRISNFRACNHTLKKETNLIELNFLAAKAEKNSKIQICETAAEDSPTLSDYFKISPLFEILIDALKYIDFWVQKGKTPEEAWNDRARSLRDARRRA